MKKLYLLFTVFLFFQLNAFGQLEFFNNKEQQKISSEKLTDAFTVNLDSLMLDSIIIAYKNSQSIPGIATLIIKDDEVIWNKDYGYRNLQFQLPVEDSTFFLMGSISKTILATAIMQLWENGLIDLEGNINNYLPSGFTVVNPYFPSDTITVKMLMMHTASLQDNWNIMDYLWSCGDYPVAFDSFLVNYFTPGGAYYSQNNFYNYPPGQSWDYSNAGSCLLALMVEHLSGKSFDEYTRDSIFIPLEMNNTSWFLSSLDTNEIATPYMYQLPVPMCQTGMAYWPIGQLRTNKLELTNFLSAYMNGGVFNNNRILNSSTIELMMMDHSGFVHLHGGIQGLIWWTYPEIFNTVWGHSGGWYGAATWMFYNLPEKWGIILFINWATPPNYTSNRPTPQMTYYAHLYGNIYAQQPVVNKRYARIGEDSVLFRTRFSNIYNHQFTPHLIYANSDSSEIDSLTLFDDGLHGDSLSSDGIYGGYIPPQQIEDFYSLGVSTIDNLTNKYFNTPSICRLTTVGPVVLDSISYTKTSTNYLVKVIVHNQSSSSTITKVSLKLICSDPWALPIPQNVRSLPNIPPGGKVWNSFSYSVGYIDSLFPGYFNFKIEVMSDGWTYWVDSTQVIVTGVDEELQQPLTFKLEQNYPNPFNPTTKISWQSPVSSRQVLKVFDVLGTEIKTLVDEEKEAGYHSVDFNASSANGGLPSGVYFYQLKVFPANGGVGSFVQTRKMILTK